MNPTCAQPRILIVEQDNELLQVIALLLEEEGYEVVAVPSLEAALKQLDRQVFNLALVDLLIGRSPHAFTEGHILRRRAHPTPVGLLTTQNLTPEDAAHQGFAFLLQEPFDIDDLLSVVATTINQPLSPEQQRLAAIVRRFFSALQNADWLTVATLCTEDLAYYPTAASPAAQRKIEGLSAYRAYAEAARLNEPASRYSAIMIFARPKGLAARFQVSWLSPDEGMPRQMTGATLFHFREERIAQIGNHRNTELVRALARSRPAG